MLEKALLETVEKYGSTPMANTLHTYRELTIARTALDKHAEIFLYAQQILSTFIQDLTQRPDQNTQSSILFLLSQLEAKSSVLIEASEKVSRVAAITTRIDIERMELVNLLAVIPKIVETAIKEYAPDKANILSQSIIARLQDHLQGTQNTFKREGFDTIEAVPNDLYSSVPTVEYTVVEG